MNAIGFIGASQFAASLGMRFGMPRLVTMSVAGFAAAMAVLLALTLAGVDSLPVLVVLLLVGFAFMGFVIPSTMVLALDEQGERAGMASALGGTLQMLLGGVMIVGRQHLLRRHGAADGHDHDAVRRRRAGADDRDGAPAGAGARDAAGGIGRERRAGAPAATPGTNRSATPARPATATRRRSSTR